MSVKGKHLLHLVPHGINSDVFKPYDIKEVMLEQMRNRVFKEKRYDFVLLYNSRNVTRKRTSNLILAYRAFCDNLPIEKAMKCCLVLHTEPALDAGTDLPVTIQALCPKYPIIFTDSKFLPEEMCLLYNICDVTVNISSSEGFGLSCAESIMCGTPVIVNMTGGLQDQVGQLDDDGNPIKFGLTFGSNNIGKYKKHGVWSKPVWPVTRTLQGSPQTPYIFDELCKWEDVADAIMYWYMIPNEKRVEFGLEGRRWAMNEGGINSKNMCAQFIKAMDFTLENFVPRESFSLHTVDEYKGHEMPFDSMGFEIPKINVDKINKEIQEKIKI